MSAISRFGPTVARSVLVQQHRQMASASTASEPIQKLFVDKIREFKATNKGLDEAHEKTLSSEITRLHRVYKIDHESKITQLDHKFPEELEVSLRDIDDSKELRAKIHSGEYQKQLTASAKPASALLASIPSQEVLDLHLPPMNKPDLNLFNSEQGVPRSPKSISDKYDYEYTGSGVTPAKLERELLVKFGDNMPTINDEKSPQRDSVNFPRQAVLETTPPTRYHIIPESWFQFFYPKTGVTGPYTFFATLGTFLLSKEWIPIEHEFGTAISTTIIFAVGISKFGPAVGNWLRQETKKEVDAWTHWQKGHIEILNEMKEHYKNELTKSNVIDELYEARKQDVDLQLVREHRSRYKAVYEDVKRRLDFLVAKADVQRQVNHSNMINWVFSNVLSSIDQKRENDVLDNCVINLKQLAQKNANVI